VQPSVNVIWTKAAIDDLTKIRAYIGENDPHAASKLATNLLQAGNSLEELPNRGRPTGLDAVRGLVVTSTPYPV